MSARVSAGPYEPRGAALALESAAAWLLATVWHRAEVRGLDNIRGEWRLVCLTHNLLKIWRYGCVVNAI